VFALTALEDFDQARIDLDAGTRMLGAPGPHYLCRSPRNSGRGNASRSDASAPHHNELAGCQAGRRYGSTVFVRHLGVRRQCDDLDAAFRLDLEGATGIVDDDAADRRSFRFSA
jgi:hypothetical protein